MHKLQQQHKDQIREWLVAGRFGWEIMKLLAEKDWPTITRQTLFHYRQRWRAEVDQARREREAALQAKIKANHQAILRRITRERLE